MQNKRIYFTFVATGLLFFNYFYSFQYGYVNHSEAKVESILKDEAIRTNISELRYKMFENREEQDLYLKNGNFVSTKDVRKQCLSCRTLQDFRNIAKHETPVKKLMILTNKRSGSSFVGEIFNQNKNAFYMFEPLFPYTRTCDVLEKERVKTFEKVIQCEIGNITQDYKHAFEITGHSQGECMVCGICFYKKHLSIIRKYNFYKSGIASYLTPINCRAHLDLSIVETICNRADFDVFKILRICSMHTLETMYQNIFNTQPDLFNRVGILHLIRDPRAIIASRLKLPLDEARRENLHDVANLLCSKMERNILYSDINWHGYETSNSVKGVRYFRVRFEDIASYSIEAADAIYRYFGHHLPVDVKLWIETVEKSGHSQDQFSTSRDKEIALKGWRAHLSLSQVLVIQDACNNLMKLMGYKLVTTEQELRNVSYNLW